MEREIYYIPSFVESDILPINVLVQSSNYTINMQNSLLAYKEIASLCGRLKETDFPHASI